MELRHLRCVLSAGGDQVALSGDNRTGAGAARGADSCWLVASASP